MSSRLKLGAAGATKGQTTGEHLIHLFRQATHGHDEIVTGAKVGTAWDIWIRTPAANFRICQKYS